MLIFSDVLRIGLSLLGGMISNGTGVRLIWPSFDKLSDDGVHHDHFLIHYFESAEMQPNARYRFSF